MERRLKLYLTLGFIIVLVSGLYTFTNWFSIVTGYLTGEDEKTKLAQCLDGKDVQFFGSDFCADCEKQKEVFKGAFRHIEEIECGKEKELCPNIRSIPAWFINKTLH